MRIQFFLVKFIIEHRCVLVKSIKWVTFIFQHLSCYTVYDELFKNLPNLQLPNLYYWFINGLKLLLGILQLIVSILPKIVCLTLSMLLSGTVFAADGSLKWKSKIFWSFTICKFSKFTNFAKILLRPAKILSYWIEEVVSGYTCDKFCNLATSNQNTFSDT